MSRMPRRRTAKAHYPRAVTSATELLPDLDWQVVWSQATAITPAASGAGRETDS